MLKRRMLCYIQVEELGRFVEKPERLAVSISDKASIVVPYIVDLLG